MKKRCMRVLCFLLILSLCLGFIPARARQASAEEAEAEVSEIVSETQEEDQGDDQLEPVEPVSEGQSEPSVPEQEQPEETTPSVVVPGIVAPSGTEVTIITDAQPQEDQPEATPAIAEKERIVITLQPSVGSVNEGSIIRLEAAATGYDTAKWYFTDPGSAHIYSAANMFDGIEGISVKASTEGGKEILTIRNTPAELDGWIVVCAFSSSAEANVQTNTVVFSVKASEAGSTASEGEATGDNATEGRDGETAPVVYGFVQSKKIGNVTVTVKAPEGTFEQGARISVKRVSLFDRADVERAVDAARDETATVVESYAFDIKVIDALGNELQPAEGARVEVCFTLDLAQDTNLEATVYHIEDGEATALDTSVEDKEVTASTDGFSYYQVEFTYGELQYVLEGDAVVELSEILGYLGMTGEVTDAESSDESLFSVEKDSNDTWIVTAKQAFTTDETLTVTINGITYIIAVTDAWTAGSNGQRLFRNRTWFNSSRGIDTLYGSRVENFEAITLHTLGGDVVYCVNPTKSAGETYENKGNGYPLNSVPQTCIDLLARAMALGFPSYNDPAVNDGDEQAATQCMVFDIICGFVNESAVGGTATRNYHHSTWGFCDPDICFASGSSISNAYLALLNRMNQPQVTVGVPSWATQYGTAHNELTLRYNSSTGLFEGQWTDTTGYYPYWNFSGTPVSGLTITQSNGTLTITATPAAVVAAGLANQQGYLLQNSNTPNRTISSSRITLYHPIYSNGNINWNYQQFAWYNPSVSVPQAWLIVRAEGGNSYPLSISKTSANTGITEGNSCYSLDGAQYAVYDSAADAIADTNRLEVLTTDASGNAESVNDYTPSTYYMKELVASPGYRLDISVHTVTLNSDGSLTGNSFTEEPGRDPGVIQIRKISSTGATISTITSGYAVFKVEFYGNDSWGGTADRTWYYKTINGICLIGNETYLDTSKPNSTRYTDSGGAVVIPNGTIKISEVSPPAGYVATDQVWTARVYQETSGGDATWHWISTANGIIGYEAEGATVENEHRNGTIEVMKKDAQGNALPGVTFLLEYSTDNGTTWNPTYKIAADALTDYGACKSQDLVDGTLTTGATGTIVFEGLMADRQILYRLTEISAPDGYLLLSSPVYVGSLPVATTALGIADTEEIEGTTYCYTLIFDVTDHSQYSLPSAGGNGFWQIPFAFIAAAIGIVLILRKKPRFG